MWHLLAEHYEEKSVFSPATRRRLANSALGIVRDRTADIAVKWGAAHFACAADGHDGRNRTRYLRNQNTILQGIIGPALPESALTPGGVIRQFLTSRDCEPGLGIASAMQAARVTPIRSAFGFELRLNWRTRSESLGWSAVAGVRSTYGQRLIAAMGRPVPDSGGDCWGSNTRTLFGLLVQAEAAF